MGCVVDVGEGVAVTSSTGSEPGKRDSRILTLSTGRDISLSHRSPSMRLMSSGTGSMLSRSGMSGRSNIPIMVIDRFPTNYERKRKRKPSRRGSIKRLLRRIWKELTN